MFRWLAALGAALLGGLPPEAASMLASWPSTDDGGPAVDRRPAYTHRSHHPRRKRAVRRPRRTKHHR